MSLERRSVMRGDQDVKVLLLTIYLKESSAQGRKVKLWNSENREHEKYSWNVIVLQENANQV